MPKVAKDIGRDPSTVRNELLKHRIASDKGYGCSNRLCAHFDECTRMSFDGFSDRKRKCQPKYFKSCPDFREASCPRLANPPFVCNGCVKERSCPLPKKFYIASVVLEQYESERSLSRTGVHPDKATFEDMGNVLSPCIKKGQSPMAVIASNAKIFGGYAKSTVYGWIADEPFSRKSSRNIPTAALFAAMAQFLRSAVLSLKIPLSVLARTAALESGRFLRARQQPLHLTSGKSNFLRNSRGRNSSSAPYQIERPLFT